MSFVRRTRLEEGRDLRRFVSLLVPLLVLGAMIVPAVALAAIPSEYFTIPPSGGSPEPAPAPYNAVEAIYGASLLYQGKPIGEFNNIQDVFVDSNGNVWVVDSGNNRVVELNSQLTKVLMIIGGAGVTGPAALNDPQGIDVTSNGFIYVADTGNKRIAVYAPNGTYLDQIKPVNGSLTLRTENVQFEPTKVAVAPNGTMFVVLNGAQAEFGLAEFNAEAQFQGFFAPNAVGFQFKYYLEKLLETKQQLAEQFPILLPTVNNATFGADGYLYTVSTSASTDQIRRLNLVGTDTLNTPTNKPKYGLPVSDLPSYVLFNALSSSGSTAPRFVSATANATGIITAVDQLTDFVFQYGPEGNLLYTFGGDSGNGQLGYFEDPTAAAVLPNNDVIVSDADLNNLQLFQPTQFASLVQKGIALDYNGHYREAEAEWEQVLHFDANYALAHYEMGEGELSAGQEPGLSRNYSAQLTYFKDAMYQFYLADDKADQGTAFSWYRHVWMRINFTWVFLTFIGAWILIYVLYKVFVPRFRAHPIQITANWARSEFVRIVPMSWRVIKHPAEAFFQLKSEHLGTWRQGVVLVIVAFAARVLYLLWANFDYNPLVPGHSSVAYEAVKFIVPLATWVFANYLVGDLYEGEASLGEIVTGSAYALIPYIVMQIPLAALTYVFVKTDHIYIVFPLFEKVWMVYLFFTQVRVLHNLDWKDSAKASLMTVAGILILWAMFAILYGEGRQAVSFVHQVIQEIIILHS